MTMVHSTLLLMGDASQHQSASRRETILQQLNPQIVDLMKEEDYTKALPFLFGEDFGAKVKTRMKEAAALKKTLSQSSKGKEKAGFLWGLPSKGHRRPWGWPTKCLQPWTIQEMETSPYHRQQTRKEMTKTASTISCRQFNKKCVSVTPSLTPIGTPSHHIQVLMGTLHLSIIAPCLAGRLPHYVKNWEIITQDRWVLQAIMGYKLDLLRTPHQGRRPPMLHHCQTDCALITEEVQELLAKQAIRETNLAQQFHIPTFPCGRERGWA